MRERDKNTNPNITVYVRGIGILSEHGRELNQIADKKLQELARELENYTKDEQYFILDRISSELCGLLLERGPRSEDMDETEDSEY